MLRTIAFDGDDTLWHHETLFSGTQAEFRALMAPFVPGEVLDAHLLAVERDNLRFFGYGVKGFTLSMIETAIALSDGRIPARDIERLIAFGKAMLTHPVELLPGARPAVEALRGAYRVLIITKGDLFDQESKVARSGLADLFHGVEIVSEKDEATYRRILQAHATSPAEFMMVGNSLRSDILPVLALGARAVHVAYPLTWAHEAAELPAERPPRFATIASLVELPAFVAALAEPAAQPG